MKYKIVSNEPTDEMLKLHAISSPFISFVSKHKKILEIAPDATEDAALVERVARWIADLVWQMTWTPSRREEFRQSHIDRVWPDSVERAKALLKLIEGRE